MKLENLPKIYPHSIALVFALIFLYLLLGSIPHDGFSLLSFNTYGELYWEIGLIGLIIITLLITEIKTLWGNSNEV